MGSSFLVNLEKKKCVGEIFGRDTETEKQRWDELLIFFLQLHQIRGICLHSKSKKSASKQAFKPSYMFDRTRRNRMHQTGRPVLGMYIRQQKKYKDGWMAQGEERDGIFTPVYIPWTCVCCNLAKAVGTGQQAAQ